MKQMGACQFVCVKFILDNVYGVKDAEVYFVCVCVCEREREEK